MANDVAEFFAAIKVSENTQRAYQASLRLYARWSGKDAPETADDAQAFLTWREVQGKEPNTVGVDAAALRRYLVWKKVDVGRLEKYPITIKPPEYLSKIEIKRLIEACDTPLMRCIVALCYDTGARINEILKVRMDEIEEEGFFQVVRKGGRVDTVNVTPWGMEYLRQWLSVRKGRHALLFGDNTYRTTYNRMNKAATRAGITKATPHMLRHSRAVHLSETPGANGVPLTWVEIAYQLGHVNPTITAKIYTRPNPRDLKRRIPAPDLSLEEATV